MQRPLSILTLLTLALLSTVGCSTASMTGSLILQPGDNAAIDARGNRPIVIIRNQGPAELDLLFVNPQGQVEGREKFAATGLRSRSGGNGYNHWKIFNQTNQSATIEYEIRAAQGMSVQQNVDSIEAQKLLDLIKGEQSTPRHSPNHRRPGG